MYQFTITITGTYSIALMKNPTYDRTFVLGHRQWFLAGQQCLVTLCKLEDHFREARKQVPAGQSSPAGFGTRQLVNQLMTSLNQIMETLETMFQNIVS